MITTYGGSNITLTAGQSFFPTTGAIANTFQTTNDVSSSSLSISPTSVGPWNLSLVAAGADTSNPADIKLIWAVVVSTDSGQVPTTVGTTILNITVNGDTGPLGETVVLNIVINVVPSPAPPPPPPAVVISSSGGTYDVGQSQSLPGTIVGQFQLSGAASVSISPLVYGPFSASLVFVNSTTYWIAFTGTAPPSIGSYPYTISIVGASTPSGGTAEIQVTINVVAGGDQPLPPPPPGPPPPGPPPPGPPPPGPPPPPPPGSGPNYAGNISASASQTVAVIGSAFGDFVITQTSGSIWSVTWAGGTLAAIPYQTATGSRESALSACIDVVNTKIAQLGDDAREALSRQVQDSIRAVLSDIRDDIRALKVVGLDHDKGIVTRNTCDPCDVAWTSKVQRALVITSLRDSRKLEEVVKEINNPTFIPGFDE